MEKSIVVKSDSEGLNVALRSSIFGDYTGTKRVVELFDVASKRLHLDPFRTSVNAVDGADLENVPAALYDKAIQAGDGSTLIVRPIHSASDGSVTVTPIIFESTAELSGAPAPNPADDADDGYYNEGSEALDTTNNVLIGLSGEGDKLWSFFSFPVAIPKFATITSAVMTVYRNDGGGSNVPDDVKIHVIPDPRPISPQGATAMKKLISLVGDNNPLGAGVAWDLGSFQNIDSPDLSTQVQRLVNDSEWAGLAGNSRVMVLVEGGNNSGTNSVTVMDVSNASDKPVLTVNYTWMGSSSTSRKFAGVMQSKVSAMGDVGFYTGSGPVHWYHSPIMAWDLFGAKLVGLHVSELSSSNTVDLYAGVI